ncbi:MAG TPA: HPF/RaiA family ribosome-associated protein [Solirubrobacteraceae bacterium]|jgi:ribosome-associated translation inhibitor RaiA|nr:HPF/RaiA family ribosome-associated protein [Solirubrobacteraceae bacterium]
MSIEVDAPEDLAPTEGVVIRERFASLERDADEPIEDLRLSLRLPATRNARPRWVADASLVFNGRQLAAHATGADALEAATEAADRLERQMRRGADPQMAPRNDRRALQRALAHLAHEPKHRPRPSFKRPDLRDIIPQRTAYPFPESTLDAVADLLDLDLEFLLFRHARTGEDVVVYRRDDGRIGLLHPPGSPLADENDIVVTEPSRYPEPIPLTIARDEMDVLNHRFLYFIDAADGRGKVLYLRHDGDYGLVEPPPSGADRLA